jgi:hypothetical protein
MSNKRKLNLQPHREVQTTVKGVTAARAGDRCEFHDDCCDPDDMTCTRGCGAPAELIVLFGRLDGTTTGTAFCSRHHGPVGALVEHMLRTQTAQAN